MKSFDPNKLEFALETMLKGTELSRLVWKRLAGESLTKDDRSPVTVADYGVQAIAGHAFEKHFGSSAVLVGEEHSAVLKTQEGAQALSQVVEFVSAFIPEANQEKICEWVDVGSGKPEGHFWVMDPIDGTKGFLQGRHYAIALAEILEGEIIFGALACPNLEGFLPGQKAKGVFVVAEKGKGTWALSSDEDAQWQRIHVSSRQDISTAVILSSFHGAHTNHSKIDDIRDLLGIEASTLNLDSQAKHAMLAGGKGDLFFRIPPKGNTDYREKIWDAAPGVIAIEEAGGRVTDLLGKPLDFKCGKTLADNFGIFASNHFFHDKVIEGIRPFVETHTQVK